MGLSLFEGGVCEDVDQDFAQLILVVIVVWVETDAQLLKSEISFSLSLHYNYRISAEQTPRTKNERNLHRRRMIDCQEILSGHFLAAKSSNLLST